MSAPVFAYSRLQRGLHVLISGLLNAAQTQSDAARVSDAAQGEHAGAIATQQASLSGELAIPGSLGPWYAPSSYAMLLLYTMALPTHRKG